MEGQNIRQYHNAVRWIQSFVRPSVQFTLDRRNPQRYLDRMRVLCAHLGNPQDAFRIIHIAGTAGKGTVATLVAGMLAAAGHRTGLYTSPYCITPIENIAVNGQYISPKEFQGITLQLKETIVRLRKSSLGSPSTFELMTAMAFLYFKQRQCAWAVIEAGLGGRYDATNIVEHPSICAITAIGLDHTNVLGKTVQAIARDKAQIIKFQADVFTNVSQEGVVGILRQQSQRVGARFHPPQRPLTNVYLSERIGTVLRLPDHAIQQVIEQTHLPCRREWVESHIVLDGAHSPVKMRYFCQSLPRRKHGASRIAVVGITSDKNKEGILRTLIPHIDTLIVTPFPMNGWGRRRSATAGELAATARRIRPSIDVRIVSAPLAALKKARALARADDLIIITGSFYLAGFLRRQWYSEQWTLRHRRSF
ncbi:hypothetical protein HZA86_04195 [Candidatus Uhrbacteria bacterium]|nr:hypothetical protein [Candidatus Uhrbacteria bacterium]